MPTFSSVDWDPFLHKFMYQWCVKEENQHVTWLSCYESPGCFDSSLQCDWAQQVSLSLSHPAPMLSKY